MPKTNYKKCWWLIQAVNGEFGTGSYLKGRGYSLRDLNDLKSPGERVKYDWFSRKESAVRERDSFRHEIMRHRAIIYNEFGLAIRQKSDSGVDFTKGNGGYFYFLDNPELLDDKSKTLRDHIIFLADSEKDRESWMTLNDMEELCGRSSSSMGFISAGSTVSYGYLSSSHTTPRVILGEENLALVQFAMEFGEVLTIKYGKVREGVGFDEPYSFEPYQVKEIEGRWYVIGNLYPLGHKESAELAVYDLARLEFAYDEENPDIFYEPIKDFDVNTHIVLDHDIKKRLESIILAEVDVNDGELFSQLMKNPLCSAQEVSGHRQLYIYSRLSNDLIVQFGAYGDEIGFKIHPSFAWNIDDEEEMEEEEKSVTKALNYFRNPQEKE